MLLSLSEHSFSHCLFLIVGLMIPITMQDLIIHKLPVDQLRPWPRNARTHTAQQIQQIVESISQFSWTNPILVGPDNVIIAGHARWLAAKKLGMTEVPVIVLAHLTESQRRAFRTRVST